MQIFNIFCSNLEQLFKIYWRCNFYFKLLYHNLTRMVIISSYQHNKCVVLLLLYILYLWIFYCTNKYFITPSFQLFHPFFHVRSLITLTHVPGYTYFELY